MQNILSAADDAEDEKHTTYALEGSQLFIGCFFSHLNLIHVDDYRLELEENHHEHQVVEQVHKKGDPVLHSKPFVLVLQLATDYNP